MRAEVGRLATIGVYPVKSLQGTAPASVEVEPWGLLGDRRWLVVDADRRFLTQAVGRLHGGDPGRRVPGRGIMLSGADLPALLVETPGGDAPVVPVTVWRDTVPARIAAAAAARWLTEALGVACQLVHLHDTAARPTNPAFAPAESRVSFADGYPCSSPRWRHSTT